MNKKSNTDIHWDKRAASEPDDALVNIADTAQRDIELKFVLKHLNPADNALEVGCGNGWVTKIFREKVAQLDAFDYAENMVARAKKNVGETNNRFFCTSVLEPEGLKGPYDTVICIRVLINLRNIEEQKKAIEVLAANIKPGGKLVLVEGYADGFEKLSSLRIEAGLPPLTPASINFYSRVGELTPTILQHFSIEDTFHTGLFDILTRAVFPALVGPDKVSEQSDFHKQIGPVTKAFGSAELSAYARLHGFALIKK
jgi:ubiquinone/menaquinone biosynthesis C-methylase UbiE